jgi:hypothetical protein
MRHLPSQTVANRRRPSQTVANRRRLSQTVADCRKPSQTVADCRRLSQTVADCRRLSQNATPTVALLMVKSHREGSIPPQLGLPTLSHSFHEDGLKLWWVKIASLAHLFLVIMNKEIRTRPPKTSPKLPPTSSKPTEIEKISPVTVRGEGTSQNWGVFHSRRG